jgi:hypothetical protein
LTIGRLTGVPTRPASFAFTTLAPVRNLGGLQVIALR